MTFVKKFTRRITVEGESYLWHLRDSNLDSEPRRIVVQHIPARGQMLFVDPFAGPWVLNFEIRPRVIREIILFGLVHGWEPKKKAAPFLLRHDGVHFVR